ncbi:hypothetical protein X777_06946 [Ooceraea biroi]|nr:hypothetical protein X777_06946 [Ooceraea biroi]
MNYEYYYGDIDGIDGLTKEVGKECEDEIIKQKELISLVKANPPLWNKRQREVFGRNFNKDLAWASAGAILKMSGSDAEKEFYKIRQRYGKERRKMTMSLKGKSGQSALPTYFPTWELYEICDTFLSPVVIPRKTSSNYMNAIPKPNSNEVPYSPTEFNVVVPEDVKSG